MASKVEQGFERSEALQAEWEILKSEMDNLMVSLARRPDSAKEARKAEIEVRMHRITSEMTAVLHAARKEVPGMASDAAEDDFIEEEDQSCIQRDTKAERHIVRRTYESTDSEIESEADISSAALRQHMMMDAMTKDPNVEYKVLTVGSGRRGFGRVANPENDKPQPSAEVAKGASLFAAVKTAMRKENRKPQTTMRELTEEERDEATLEISKVQRELRKLKKKAGRSPDDEAEQERLNERLRELNQQLETNMKADAEDGASLGTRAQEQVAPASTRASALAAARTFLGRPGGQGSEASASGSSTAAASPSSHRSGFSPTDGSASGSQTSPFRNSNDDDLPPVEDDIDGEGLGTASRSKNRKAVENSVQQFKNLAARRKARDHNSSDATQDNGAVNQNGSSKQTAPPRGIRSARGAGFSWRSGSTRQQNASPEPSLSPRSQSAYAELGNKLSKRGEKLDQMDNQAEAMAESANDFASAVHAMRKRQAKGGLFG